MIESIKNGDIKTILISFHLTEVSIKIKELYLYVFYINIKNVRLNETISLQCARLTYNFSHNSHNF